MFIGMVLGFLIGSLVVLGGIAIDSCKWEDSFIYTIISIIIAIIITIAGTLLGINFYKVDYEKKVNTYITTKQTIENAMQSKELTSLEKIELVKQINEQNQKLEELKVDVKQWYNFYLDASKVNELQPIKIKVGE